MSAATSMADEARGAISTNSLCENREGLGRGQPQQRESRQAGREGGRQARSAVKRLRPISARCLPPLPPQSPAPLQHLRPHLPHGTENQERSHGQGAAQQEPLAVTPSRPSLWPWASTAGEGLPPSTSVLPREWHSQAVATGTGQDHGGGGQGTRAVVAGLLPALPLLAALPWRARRHRAGVSQLLTRLLPGSVTPARGPTC